MNQSVTIAEMNEMISIRNSFLDHHTILDFGPFLSIFGNFENIQKSFLPSQPATHFKDNFMLIPKITPRPSLSVTVLSVI